MAERALDVAQFLSGNFDPAAFSHREHVRMGYEMLRRHSFVQAALHYSESLQALARRLGAPDAFHQTITIAFLSLIAERLDGSGYPDFESFAAANADLMDKSILTRWYPPEKLARGAARRTFVLPEPAR